MLLGAVGLVAATGLLGPLACGTTASVDALAPITGITVRAEALTAGYGCGSRSTQIFKYLVVVYGANPDDANAPTPRRDEFLASNVYDCFADGQFVQLPVSGGSAQYALQVFAYNAAAYAAAGGDAGLGATTARLQALRAAQLADGGTAERAAIKAELARLSATNPTYSTTCEASQVVDVQSLAVCQPLALGASAVGGGAAAPATALLSTASFPGPDGGLLVCDDQYTSVRYRYGTGATFTAPAESRCSRITNQGLEPFVITVSPALAPASYTFQVALLRGDGSVLRETTCTAETSPALTSSAICKQVP